MIIRAIDFETTGLTPQDAICEVGWCDVDFDRDKLTAIVGQPQAMLTDPGRKIPIEAMACHHIRDANVHGMPKPAIVLEMIEADADAFCAHNARYERQYFGGGGKPWLCTYKNAVKYRPKQEGGHGIQALRYSLALDLDEALAMPPHRAGPDAYVCAHIIARMLTKIPIDSLIATSEAPVKLPYFCFGAHAMKPLEDVPDSYLEWILGPKGIADDQDVRYTAQYHLERRRQPMESDRGSEDGPSVSTDQVGRKAGEAAGAV